MKNANVHAQEMPYHHDNWNYIDHINTTMDETSHQETQNININNNQYLPGAILLASVGVAVEGKEGSRGAGID